MKSLAIVLFLFLAAHASAEGPPVRTTKDLHGLPLAPLRQMVKPAFFKSLMMSPIEAWVMVQGRISEHRFAGMRVTHSELEGKYDALALEMAKLVHLKSGWEPALGTNISAQRVRFDLLIYKIKDGKMAVGFAQSDEADGSFGDYYGRAFMAFEKDGKWTLAP